VQAWFEEVAAFLENRLEGGEIFTASFVGETSDFVRINRGRVRQAGRVSQRHVTLDLIEGRRHATGTLALSAEPRADRDRLDHLVRDLRELRGDLPEDPHLLYATDAPSGEVRRIGRLPAAEEVLDAVRHAGRERDFVGLYAAGPIQRGFASSLGQRNWFESESYHLDWSFHGAAGAAVKCDYAGREWNVRDFSERADAAAEQLAALARPVRTIEPGRHRVYLAPAAVHELLSILGWGGFGLRAHRTGASPLLRMTEADARLSAAVTLSENTADGIAPSFEVHGFACPDVVPLVQEGRFVECLVSPRSAVEYGVPTNGASAEESPISVDMGGGSLARDAVLREIGNGLYVGNLWYLNYSDKPACRTTGMTRFATFAVDNGVLAAPVPAMRFDETIYRLLGDALVGLTRERETILDSDTYGRRSTRSARVPGALVDGLTFTL